MTVRIVTDSTADIPPELVERYRIAVVPLSILFGDEVLLDGVDIQPDQFFRRLARDSAHPTTSQPSPAAFRETYERLRGEGATEILSIHVSEKLSGTLASARQAAEGLEGVRVRHVDSRLVSLAMGIGVIEAARLAEAGGSLDECRATAEDVFDRTRLFFVLDTLEYLRRGGRIGRASEIVGSLLKVKPILAVVDGEVVAVTRVRTWAKALEQLLTRVAELRPIEHAAAVHATAPRDLEYVANRLRGIAPDAEILTADITPVLGVHAGPGMVGVTIVRAPDGASPAPPPP